MAMISFFPMKEKIEILRLGKAIGGGVEWFDFKNVPQRFIIFNGVGVLKPKFSRKFPHINGNLIDPSDDQVFDQAKRFLSKNLNPDDFEFVIVDAPKVIN